jgi:hypothetical protein
MNQKSTFKKVFAALFLSTTALAANATSYLTENFDYTVGDLYNQGGWVKFGTQTENPIQIVSGGLTYSGYQDEAVGGRVSITNPQNSNEQDLHKRFTENDGIYSGAIYMAALINVKSVDGDQFILAFDGRTKNSEIVDGKSTSNYWRLFLSKGTADDTFKFGLAKNKASITAASSTEYNLNTTYLVVLKYEFVDGSPNDVFSLYVNPATASEPTTADASTYEGTDATTIANGSKSDYGIGGVVIMQNGSDAKGGPEFDLDAIRIADSWADLFSGGSEGSEGGGGEVTTASITAPESVDFGYSVTGYALTQTINVKAKGLTEGITLSTPTNSVFTLSAETIDKEAAMSAAGADVVVTFNPTAEGDFSGSFTLTSEGADTKTVNITAGASAASAIPTASALNNQAASDALLFRYSGKAIVTYIDTTNKKVYAQDMTGAFAIDYQYVETAGVNVGDQITNVVGMRQDSFGAPEFLLQGLPIQVLSTDNSKTPTEVTLSDILSDPLSYIYRLVTVSNVKIEAEEGATFSTSGLNISDGEKSGKLLPFANSDLIGTAVPTGTITLTGICRSATIASISPRNTEDLQLGAPAFDVTLDYTYTGDPIALNTPTVVKRYKVAAENLTTEAQVYLTGTNKGMFSVSTESIAAGSSNVTVEVTYTPTAIGKHLGRINFDVTPSELSGGENFQFYAYDPENLPTITVNDTPEEFTAKPSETQEQKITITTANFVDYGSIKVMGDSNGAFRINNTMLLKTGDTNLTITFAPLTEGEYTERIEFSGLMAETQYLTVTGKCEGEKPVETTEGDELNLTTENPLTLLNEDFSGIGDNNKPLSLQGWCNVAAEGTRAWWNYSFADDGNKAAKVTAYDSKVAAGESTDCQMLLVTPPLDFVNSASKILTFRVMGHNLLENQSDLLEVLYMDMADGELYTQAFKDLNIPATADYNDEWIDYVIDLENSELADVFFIGFRFTSSRGVDNSAIYYIDDVTYGRTDVPQIKPEVTEMAFETELNKSHQESVYVRGLNLTSNIKASIGGDNPSKFSLATTTLPAEGGELQFTFLSEEVGVHSAYIALESTGAPTAYILLTVNNKQGSGISAILPDANGKFTVVNTQGVTLLRTANATELQSLAPGIYIVNGKKYVVK